jgi:hypothetical protein
MRSVEPVKLKNETRPPSPKRAVTAFGASMPGVRLSTDAVGIAAPVGHAVM